MTGTLRNAIDEDATSNSARFRLAAEAVRGAFPADNPLAVAAVVAADLFADFYAAKLFDRAPAYVNDYWARLDLVVQALVEAVEPADGVSVRGVR